MKTLTIVQLKEMFTYVGEKIIENKPLLTEIDSAIGDGDHGTGMSLGFSTAIEQLAKKDFDDVNDVFKTIGMSLLNTMGGASGVIFGTMFIGAVKNVEKINELNLQSFVRLFENSLEAVKARGKASVGDKTMIDAFEPAVKALSEQLNVTESLLEAFVEAEKQAQIGLENTKNYVAKFGRAKSLGDRAIGHQDAGATSVWIIFKSIREWIESKA